MKKSPKSLTMSAALKRWREKHPSLVKPTVLAWIADGLVKANLETHGFQKWHTFTKDEVERVYSLLRKNWQQGEPVLPRPSKFND